MSEQAGGMGGPGAGGAPGFPKGSAPRDFSRELAESVAAAAADGSVKSDADRIRAIEQRAALHDAAVEQTKAPNVRVTTPEVARQWAEVDARDFRALSSEPRREDAAVNMAANANANPDYRRGMTKNIC